MRIVKKILKVLGYVVGVLLVLILIALLYVFFAYPKSEAPPDVTVAGTPEQVERGRYLFQAVACVQCHSVEDDAGRVVALGKENWEQWVGEGGAPFFPPNLTPAALGDWTDGEIMRAISSGVRRDGKALFPVMPYDMYAHLSRPDLESLVAYLRTLPSIPVEHPRERLGFPFSLIARISPRPADPPARTPAGGVELGRYIAATAGCEFCHTPGSPPRLDRTRAFQGGHEFFEDGWLIRTANLTPDSATGLGTWTRERFVTRFKGAAGMPNTVPVPGGGEAPKSPMPWEAYSHMSEHDLGALYDYLRTLEPADRPMVRAERAPAEE